MTKEELIIHLKELDLNLTDHQLEQIDKFCLFLLEENKKYNLTAIRKYEDVLLKHVYDSLTIVKAMNLSIQKNLLDIGSGAGFPGIIIKIVFPHLEVTLLDSNGKKTRFLEQAKELLDLEGLEVVTARAEDYIKNSRNKFEIVTARAVAHLRILTELAVPFLKQNEYFVAMKGKLNNEIEESADTISLLNAHIENVTEFTLPIENSHRNIIVIKKIAETPEIYPRSNDQIQKKPLLK